jgi:hypothetical protein
VALPVPALPSGRWRSNSAVAPVQAGALEGDRPASILWSLEVRRWSSQQSLPD